MATHLTPTELGRELAMHRRHVIAHCVRFGIPIFAGRIDRTLFQAALEDAGVAVQGRDAEPAGDQPPRESPAAT